MFVPFRYFHTGIITASCLGVRDWSDWTVIQPNWMVEDKWTESQSRCKWTISWNKPWGIIKKNISRWPTVKYHQDRNGWTERRRQTWYCPSTNPLITIYDNLWCNATDTVSDDERCMDRKWKYECKYQNDSSNHLITNHFSWSFLQGNELIIQNMSTISHPMYTPFGVGRSKTDCVSWSRDTAHIEA